MARIADSEIERLKREVSLERLVEASGVELKRMGKNLVGRCPFHDDHNPSLIVTPSTNLWRCPPCGATGNPIQWVMKMNGVSFRHAVELLREGITATAAQPLKHSTVRKLPPPVALDADDQALLNQVIGYYHETLKGAPEAMHYLETRGIANAEAFACFKLGFANRTLGLRLPARTRVAGAAMRARLTKIGILRATGHEHFNGSLVIPVMDEKGDVIEVYGRKITAGLRPGTPEHLFLPAECRGPSRGVWNVEALAASKEIIVCEALIDALTFWCAGFRNVTAAYGTEGFSDEMLAAFKRYGTARVLIAYDRDEPGERAAEKLASRLIGEGLEAWRIQFPKGMDANEYALKVQPAVKSLGVVIRKALWLGKGTAPQRSESAAPIAAEGSPAPAVLEAIEPEPSTCARADAPSSLAAEFAAKEKLEAPATMPAAPASASELPASPMPLAASPVPPAPADDVAMQVNEAEVTFTFADRRYRVRGLAENENRLVLKLSVLAVRGERLYIDTVDLMLTKPRTSYAVQAAAELGVTDEIVKGDLAKMFGRLEALRDAAILAAAEPKGKVVALAEAEREEALALLRSPNLIARIVEDLEACGLVGERVNKLVAYLAATSRKLDAPLAVLVQSSSAAGKSTLMDAVLALMPEEERVKYSAMTGQALYYGEDLKHKILAIVEEEGAARAAYALKLLHSEGELTIASTGKNPVTGDLETRPYRVEGPTMLFTTTTAAEIDPELQNRCLVLAVDESREQTRSIHRLQRDKRTLEGLARKARKKELQRLHQNAQRMLRPLEVLNPYSESLTFPDQATRTRRDHEKYLTLIDIIALVHQHQREIQTTLRDGSRIEYIEAQLSDIALANELAHEVLGRSLDELPPQTRRTLEILDAFVAGRAKDQAIERAQVRFSRRELREATAIGDTQLRLHLDRLASLEYLLVHRGARGSSFVYELVYDGAGADGKPFVAGLIDVERLRSAPTTANLAGGKNEFAGQTGEFAGSTRGQSGPNAGGSRPAENAATSRPESDSGESSAKPSKTHILGGNGKDPSYPQNTVVPLAARALED
jgi:DNA primase catalytic core